jgi:hypothetical protein
MLNPVQFQIRVAYLIVNARHALNIVSQIYTKNSTFFQKFGIF